MTFSTQGRPSRRLTQEDAVQVWLMIWDGWLQSRIAAHFDVMQQTINHQIWATAFPRAMAEPCLQVADYCAWAIQRKWERNDTRSYDKIRNKIRREYDLFERGSRHYYT